MKRTLMLLLGCIFALALFSCKIDDTDDDSNESIFILVNNAKTIFTTETGQLLILRLSNGVSAIWSVSDTSVATLSATSGVAVCLTTQTTGSVTVTATVDGKQYIHALQITAKGNTPNDGETNAPNVKFVNQSAYKVVVCRDGLSTEIATVEADGTKSIYVSSGTNGITFHFRYSYCIISDDDCGTIWIDVADNGAYTYPVNSADIASDAVQINIPAPKNPQFNVAYLKVENQSAQPVSLYNGITQQKLYNQEKYYIQTGHSGVYNISPDAMFEGFSLGVSPASATAIAPFYVASGVLYTCEFVEADSPINMREEMRLGELWAENIKDYYKVCHFEQNTDLTEYTLKKTEWLRGTRGTKPVVTAMSYIGFTAKVFERKPISSDGTTIVDVYYDRNEYTVTFNANNGTDDTQTQTFYYGIAEKLKDNIFSNSSYDFLGWATSKTGNSVYNNKADFLIDEQNPTDITLYAVWSRIIVTADAAKSIDLSNITDEYTIKVVGDISQSTLGMLASKIRTAKYPINLDLSEATGLTVIRGVYRGLLYNTTSIFADCPLNSVALPETLEAIGSYAFARCSIKSVTIPASVQGIGTEAFSYCSNLEAIEIDGIESVASCAFWFCESLKTVTLKNVNTIGENAFRHCTNLSSVIMESIDYIGSYAFADCENLLSVTMESIGSIGSDAFSNCSTISSITIDAETIRTRAFSGCTSLIDVVIGKNVKLIDNVTFYSCFDECPLIEVRFEDTEGWYYFNGNSSTNERIYIDVTDVCVNASNLISANSTWFKELRMD